MHNKITLFYIHDPMCSWCWGFKPVFEAVTQQLSEDIEIKYLLGGLAADTDTAMPEKLQTQIQSNWLKIQQTIPGIKFNYDFWSKCKPRRSTYPACRAVIAAEKQQMAASMITAIQHAYYLQARNPSDYKTLYELADELNLDTELFKRDIHESSTDNQLSQEIALSRSIGADSLPSIFVLQNEQYYPVVLDYNNPAIILEHISSFNNHD